MITKPIPTLWNQHRLSLIRGFAMIAAGSVAFNTFFIFMPNHLARAMRLDIASTLSISALTLLVAAAAAVTLGRLSDVVGRRPVAIWSTAALAGLAAPMSVFASTSRLGLLFAQIAIGAAMAGVLLVAMVGELFPRHFVRLECR
jgi:MFS family permease